VDASHPPCTVLASVVAAAPVWPLSPAYPGSMPALDSCHALLRRQWAEESERLEQRRQQILPAAGTAALALRERWPELEAVWLFGSKARPGMLRHHSDLDLEVAGLPPEAQIAALGLVERVVDGAVARRQRGRPPDRSGAPGRPSSTLAGAHPPAGAAPLLIRHGRPHPQQPNDLALDLQFEIAKLGKLVRDILELGPVAHDPLLVDAAAWCRSPGCLTAARPTAANGTGA